MPSSNGDIPNSISGGDSGGNGSIAAATVAVPLRGSKSWACHMCSYENLDDQSNKNCEICLTPRLTNGPSSEQSNKTTPTIAEWSCPKCTYLNALSTAQCAVCNEPRPSPSSVPAPPHQQQPSQSSTSRTTTTRATASVTKSIDQWDCPQCTFANKSTTSRCDMCQYKKSTERGRGDHQRAVSTSRLTNNDHNKRPATACASACEPPMLLPSKVEGEFMDDLRAIEESEANEKYQRILMYCRENKQRFVDDSFPPIGLSLRRRQDSQMRQLPAIQWLRPKQILNGSRRGVPKQYPWTVYNSPEPCDIIQGILGNCWFLSALALVAERKDILEHIVVTKEVSAEGVYQIRLCVEGQWRVIVVDDLFPCDADHRSIYSRAKRNQLWVPLIEKALAKVFGSYEALTAGRTVEGLTALTGAPSEAIHLPGGRYHEDPSQVDQELIWAQLLSMKEAGFLMGASCGGDRQGKQAEYHLVGLEPLHAYSLLDVRVANGHRLVKCRNPWGHFSWNGAWSEHSNLWTNELRAELMPENFQDGVFWMPYEDFCRYFDTIDACRYRSNWRELRLAGILPPHCRENFVYVAELAVQEATEVDVALHQQNARNEKPTKHGILDLSVMIFSVDQYGRPAELVARSDHALRPFVTLNAILQPGQYIMTWMSFNHWGMRLEADDMPKSMVSIHSARSIRANVRSVNPIIMADCMMPMFVKDGTHMGTDVPGKSSAAAPNEEGVAVYYLKKNWTGVAVMVANYNTDFVLSVQCDCSESQNAVSTRGALITHDLIQPMHRQILLILSQVEGSEMSRFSYKVQYRLMPILRNQMINYANRVLNFFGAQSTLPNNDHHGGPNGDDIHPDHMPPLDADVLGLHSPRPIA